jgi:pilus assembly protein CpaB
MKAMMSRQAMIALGAAVILGLVAVFIANAYLSGKEQQAYAHGTTKVAVATAPLAYGTDITPDKVRFVDYPNTSIPPGAFSNATQLMPAGKRRVALLPIAVNEPILSGKISGPGQNASIAALLPEGMRAASVRINDVSGVSGFVQPNDSVDVLITRDLPGSDTQVTDVLLQNVRVMAIDQQATNADGSAKVAKTATLMVSPLDAQKLALAQQVGSLNLVLRKPGEQDNPVVETVSMNDLRYNIYGGARYPAPAVVGSFGSGLPNGIASAMNGTPAQLTDASAAAPKPAAKPRKRGPAPKSIEVYRGTKSDQVKVGGYGG